MPSSRTSKKEETPQSKKPYPIQQGASKTNWLFHTKDGKKFECNLLNINSIFSAFAEQYCLEVLHFTFSRIDDKLTLTDFDPQVAITICQLINSQGLMTKNHVIVFICDHTAGNRLAQARLRLFRTWYTKYKRNHFFIPLTLKLTGAYAPDYIFAGVIVHQGLNHLALRDIGPQLAGILLGEKFDAQADYLFE